MILDNLACEASRCLAAGQLRELVALLDKFHSVNWYIDDKGSRTSSRAASPAPEPAPVPEHAICPGIDIDAMELQIPESAATVDVHFSEKISKQGGLKAIAHNAKEDFREYTEGL